MILSVTVISKASEPALVVIVFAAGQRRVYEPGQTIWIAAGQEQRIQNGSDAAIEFLRFDLKPPAAKPAIERTAAK